MKRFLLLLLLTFPQFGRAADPVLDAAYRYLDTLRATPDALAGLNLLTGQSLPASGSLSVSQQQFLVDQLFNQDGSHTLAYDHPQDAAQHVAHGGNYLVALRATPEALDSLRDLSGITLPATGKLSNPQIQALFTQLFHADGSFSQAYNQPTQTAQNLPHGRDYLQALRNTPGALTSLKTLSGVELPSSGPLPPNQTEQLFGQMFDASGKPQVAYTNPVQAALILPVAVNYLDALRAAPGALAALQNLTGVSIPPTGPIPADQAGAFFGQLFDDNGLTKAARAPADAVQDLLHANAYLDALRRTPGALDALQQVTGVLLPTTGPLSAIESSTLFKQLYDQNGQPTDAYKNPVGTAQLIAEAGAPSEVSAVRIASLAMMTVATLGMLNSFSFLSSVPMWGWAGIAVAGAIMLFTSLFGAKDKPLAVGDVPNFATAKILPVVGGLAVMGVSAMMSPSAPDSVQSPLRPVSVSVPAITNSPSRTVVPRDSIPQMDGRTPVAMRQVMVGPYAPGEFYQPFFLPSEKDPTGLTPNPAAQRAVMEQRNRLEQVRSAGSPGIGWAALEAAGAAGLVVQTVPQ